MKPASLLKAGIEAQKEQPVTDLGGLNSILYPELPCASKIGYCPMIEGSSTKFSTVYTVMKHAQKMCTNLGQVDTIITFDLALYTKATKIQMKFLEESSGAVIRLGEFHKALNFLSLLGKKFCSSGLEDLLIESRVYRAGTASAVLKEKSYNRGIRAPKLTMGAHFRLMLDAFTGWYASHAGDGEEHLVDEDAVIRKAEECRCTITMKADVQTSINESQQEITELRSLFQDFTAQSRAKSKMFAFWEEYGDMVKLLLQFVKAERTIWAGSLFT